MDIYFLKSKEIIAMLRNTTAPMQQHKQTLPDSQHCSNRPAYIYHTWKGLLSWKMEKKKFSFSTQAVLYSILHPDRITSIWWCSRSNV